MKNRRVLIIIAVLIVALALVVAAPLAQGGPPNGGGGGRPGGGGGNGGGGGRPEPAFVTVSGTLASYGEALGFTVGNQQYVIDFGPEWYVPNECLVGLLGGPGSTYTLQNGRYTIQLTCVAGSGSQCTQVSAPASGRGPNSGNLWLASPRPGAGTQVTVWGTTESKEGYILVRAWEVQYGGGAWTWWRWEGQPWQKSQFLSCDPAGEGE